MLRTTYIIKPRLQIKYLIIALIVVCVTAISVYYAFWSALITAPGMDELSSADWHVLQRGYQTSFIWVVVILILAIGIESIFLFHKLAGPLFVLERRVKGMAEGDFAAAVHLRRRDELKDVATSLQGMNDAVTAAVKADRNRITEIQSHLDKGEVAPAKEKLAGLTRWFKITE